jgi:hypothetical protein
MKMLIQEILPLGSKLNVVTPEFEPGVITEHYCIQ